MSFYATAPCWSVQHTHLPVSSLQSPPSPTIPSWFQSLLCFLHFLHTKLNSHTALECSPILTSAQVPSLCLQLYWINSSITCHTLALSLCISARRVFSPYPLTWLTPACPFSSFILRSLAHKNPSHTLVAPYRNYLLTCLSQYNCKFLKGTHLVQIYILST